MTRLTIDIADNVYQRLVNLARFNEVSLNQLIEDLSRKAVTDFDRRKSISAAVDKSNKTGNQGIRTMLDEHFLDVKGMI